MIEKRKRGRPPTYPGEVRKVHSFRLRERTREKIMAAATENGRSYSEEIECRLERSFDLPAFAEEVASQVVAKMKGEPHG